MISCSGSLAPMLDAHDAFARLFTIIQRLRGPDGCPWDREQSPRTLRAALIEEAWECVSAIDVGDDANMEEELGDLYLLVTMMAWMKEQEGRFTVHSALTSIADKLVRRHPHVFAGAARGDADQVLVQWDQIKAAEKATKHSTGGAGSASGGAQSASGGAQSASGGAQSASGGAQSASGGAHHHLSSLDGVPSSFPPLEKAAKLQKKAAKVGFDWPGPQPVWNKIDEELRELRAAVEAGDPPEIEAEMGDLLFSVVNLARLLRVDPGLALHRTNTKFERRFREVERRLAADGTRPAEAGLDKMDALWNQIKSEEPPLGESVFGGAESASGGAESASGGAHSTSK
jgi:tetrapyrrole methylase family protein/MazG family protein